METQEAMTMEVVTKKCRVCGKELPIERFSIDRKAKDGHRNICKDCHNIYQKEQRLIREGKVLNAPNVEPSVAKECDDMGLDKIPARLLIHELRRRGYRGEL